MVPSNCDGRTQTRCAGGGVGLPGVIALKSERIGITETATRCQFRHHILDSDLSKLFSGMAGQMEIAGGERVDL